MPRKRKKGSIQKAGNNRCHNSSRITRICSMSTPYVHGMSASYVHGMSTPYVHGMSTSYVHGMSTSYVHGRNRRHTSRWRPSGGRQRKFINLQGILKYEGPCIHALYWNRHLQFLMQVYNEHEMKPPTFIAIFACWYIKLTLCCQ